MERIPKTQKKLREAKFFLGRMSEALRSIKLEKEDFEFFLSAFLSAGRSVTFVLRAEQADVYQQWYDGWQKALDAENRELLEFMNQQRIAEVHRRGADVQAEIEMVPVSELEMGPGRDPRYSISGGWGREDHLLKSEERLTILTGLLAEKKSWKCADLTWGCSNGWYEILTKYFRDSPDRNRSAENCTQASYATR